MTLFAASRALAARQRICATRSLGQAASRHSGWTKPLTPRWIANNPPEVLAQRRYNSEAVGASPDVAKVTPPDHLSEGELDIFETVQAQLEPVYLEVQDISGGCGSMYALDITAAKFAGMSVIKQHRLVNQVLGDRIKQWHGVQLKTRAP